MIDSFDFFFVFWSMEFNIGTGVFKRDSVFLCSSLSVKWHKGSMGQYCFSFQWFWDHINLVCLCICVQFNLEQLLVNMQITAAILHMCTFGQTLSGDCLPYDLYHVTLTFWLQVIQDRGIAFHKCIIVQFIFPALSVDCLPYDLDLFFCDLDLLTLGNSKQRHSLS